ncbi:MAG: hypothetical protein IID45_01370 [Planctomycetes bacterium]|nr:hypothetical protein [Planctomycetota bacterium]
MRSLYTLPLILLMATSPSARAAAPDNSARSIPGSRGKSIAANRTRPPQSFTKRKSSAAKNSFHFRVTLPQLPRLPQTPLRTAQLQGRPNDKQQRGGRSLQFSKPRDDALRRKILASAVPIRVIFIFRRQRAAQ